jgi:hypothetical protein
VLTQAKLFNCWVEAKGELYKNLKSSLQAQITASPFLTPILVIDIADAEHILSLILVLSVYYRQVRSAHTRSVFIVILWESANGDVLGLL